MFESSTSRLSDGPIDLALHRFKGRAPLVDLARSEVPIFRSAQAKGASSDDGGTENHRGPPGVM